MVMTSGHLGHTYKGLIPDHPTPHSSTISIRLTLHLCISLFFVPSVFVRTTKFDMATWLFFNSTCDIGPYIVTKRGLKTKVTKIVVFTIMIIIMVLIMWKVKTPKDITVIKIIV